jgi:hypothetical protein
MTDKHPITPPPELVQQWTKLYEDGKNLQSLFYGIFEAGADQELEACCEWIYKLMDRGLEWSMDLRAARRPKPPSLKKLALAALNEIEDRHAGPTIEEELIRRALEQLPDNE